MPQQRSLDESVGSLESAEMQTPAKGKRYEDVIDNLGIQEDDEKPFWAKFLKSDHEEEPKSLLGGVLAVLDG